MTTYQMMKQAEDRAHDLRRRDFDNARQLSDALTDVLIAVSNVGGALVDIEKQVDLTTDRLIERVRAARAAYDLAALELTEHVCDVLEIETRMVG